MGWDARDRGALYLHGQGHRTQMLQTKKTGPTASGKFLL